MQKSLLHKARSQRIEALLAVRRKSGALRALSESEPGLEITNIFTDLDWGSRASNVIAFRSAHAGMMPFQ